MPEPKPLASEPDAMAKRETFEPVRAYYRITSAYVMASIACSANGRHAGLVELGPVEAKNVGRIGAWRMTRAGV